MAVGVNIVIEVFKSLKAVIESKSKALRKGFKMNPHDDYPIQKDDNLLVSIEKRAAPEEIIHGLRNVLVHPDVKGVEILPT